MRGRGRGTGLGESFQPVAPKQKNSRARGRGAGAAQGGWGLGLTKAQVMGTGKRQVLRAFASNLRREGLLAALGGTNSFRERVSGAQLAGRPLRPPGRTHTRDLGLRDTREQNRWLMACLSLSMLLLGRICVSRCHQENPTEDTSISGKEAGEELPQSPERRLTQEERAVSAWKGRGGRLHSHSSRCCLSPLPEAVGSPPTPHPIRPGESQLVTMT